MNAFDQLRATGPTAEPDRRFVDRLRADITTALSPTIRLPERSTTVPTVQITSDTPTAAAPAVHATSLVPYIAVRGAADAIAWYGVVFGARETVRYTGDDGLVGHAELSIGDVTLYVSDEYPDYGAVGPRTLGGTTVALNLQVSDVDAVHARAAATDATVLREPADQPYGDRSCTFLDPWGHRWIVQTPVANPTTEEIEAGMPGFTISAGSPAAGARVIRAPRLDDRTDVHLLGIRDEVAMTDLGDAIPRLLDEVTAWLEQQAVSVRKPLVRYHAIDPARGTVDVTIGYAIDGGADPGDERVVHETLLAGRYASLVYAGLEGYAANAVLVEWAGTNGVRWDRWDGERGDTFASRVEFLLTGPDDDPDPAAWLTEVAIKVASDVDDEVAADGGVA